jgi:hypothetical protein
VHAAYLGANPARPLLYIINSMMMNEDDHEDRLNDSAYRLDLYDLTRGERISRTYTGIKNSRWLGSNDTIAWLTNRDMGVYACNVLKGEVAIEEEELVGRNPGNMKQPVDSAWYIQGRGLLVAPHDTYSWINDATFTAIPTDPSRPFPAAQASDSDGVPAFPSAEPSLGNDRAKLFLRDIGTRRPLEPGPKGSSITYRRASADDAPFVLTALAADGRVLWTATSEQWKSAPGLRAALRLGKDLILITDEEILYVDITTGALARRVEM